jgi:hypothetical protein
MANLAKRTSRAEASRPSVQQAARRVSSGVDAQRLLLAVFGDTPSIPAGR